MPDPTWKLVIDMIEASEQFIREAGNDVLEDSGHQDPFLYLASDLLRHAIDLLRAREA